MRSSVRHVQRLVLAVLIESLASRFDGSLTRTASGPLLVVERDRVYELNRDDSRTLAAVGTQGRHFSTTWCRRMSVLREVWV